MKPRVVVFAIAIIAFLPPWKSLRTEGVQQTAQAVSRTVQLPLPLDQKPRQDEIKNPKFGYESRFKLLRSSKGDELFVSGGRKCCAYFAVSLDGNFAIRQIDKKVWESGEEVKPFKFLAEGYPVGEGITVKRDRIEYQGKSFAKSGKSGARAYLSQNGTWIAVVGYSLKRIWWPPIPTILDGLRDVKIGAEYLQIYHLSSGKKSLPKTLKRSNPEDGNAFSTLLWIDDRYLVAPVEGMQTFLLVVHPQNQPSPSNK